MKNAMGISSSALLTLLMLAPMAHAATSESLPKMSIHLNDGIVLRGAVTGETDTTVTIDSEELGVVTVRRSRLVAQPPRDTAVRAATAHTIHTDPDPIGHALVLMPTAFLPPKGALVFRDFELLFLTLGYSPTASTSIVAGAMFPISADFNALTFGIKQGLYQDEAARNALAVVGNVTVPVGREINEAGFLWLASLVGSHRFNDRVGAHAAVGGVGVQGRGESAQNLSLAAGVDARATGNVKFLAEVLRGGTSFDPNSSLTLLNFGVRLHGDRLSADLCAVRPLEGQLGDLFFIPLINVGYRF